MQYLDAMGIEMFVPRMLLPNSMPARQCPLPEAVSASAAPVLVDPEALVSTLKPAKQLHVESRVLPELARGVHELVVAPTTAPPETVVESPSQTDVSEASEPPPEIARFSLSLWWIGEDVLVLDSREPRAALPTDRLLANMLVVAGLMTLNLPKSQELVWPLSGSSGRDQSWRAASEMVNELLETRTATRPVKYVLLFGENSARALLDGDDCIKDKLLVEMIGDVLPLERFSAKLALLPSLADILREPAKKPLVWQSLLNLRSL